MNMTTIANVKDYVKLLGSGNPCGIEIVVDVIAEKFTNFNRNHILVALKELEKEKVGYFIPGRKGAKSRFCFGVKKQKVINSRVSVLISALTKLIESKKKTANDSQIVIYTDDLIKKFSSRDIIDAFSIMENNGLGIYLVGRKGNKSRFEVGRTREETKHKTVGSEYDLLAPEDGPFSKAESTVVDLDDAYFQHNNEKTESNNIGFKLRFVEDFIYLMQSVGSEFSTVMDAVNNSEKLDAFSLADKTKFGKQLIRFGFVKLDK